MGCWSVLAAPGSYRASYPKQWLPPLVLYALFVWLMYR
jgi:hypothetical protein